MSRKMNKIIIQIGNAQNNENVVNYKIECLKISEYFLYMKPWRCCWKAKDINNISSASWDGSHVLGKPNLCKEWILIFISLLQNVGAFH